jgi:hypothetical protein
MEVNIGDQTIEIKRPDYGLDVFIEKARRQEGHKLWSIDTGDLTIVQTETRSFLGQINDHTIQYPGPDYTTLTSAVLRDGEVIGGKNLCRISGRGQIITTGMISGENIYGYSIRLKENGESEHIEVNVGNRERSERVDLYGDFQNLAQFGGIASEFLIMYDALDRYRKTSGEVPFYCEVINVGNERRFVIDPIENRASDRGSPEKRHELPFELEGTKYTVSEESGSLITASIEKQENRRGVRFPQLLNTKTTGDLERILKTDSEWLDLPIIMPIELL